MYVHGKVKGSHLHILNQCYKFNILFQWEKTYAGRFQAVQENLSVSLRSALREAPLHPAQVQHVHPEHDHYPRYEPFLHIYAQGYS